MNVNKLCQNVPDELRPEVKTLAKAVEALQNKLEEQIDVYNDMPLAQMLTTTQGEKALKANPAVQEFRATVREYAQALNSLQDFVGKFNTGTAAAPNKNAKLHVVGQSKWKRA